MYVQDRIDFRKVSDIQSLKSLITNQNEDFAGRISQTGTGIVCCRQNISRVISRSSPVGTYSAKNTLLGDEKERALNHLNK